MAGLKGVLNVGIGMLEKFANAALDAVTAPVGILNKIPGVKSIIPDVPNIHIPRLAAGGIVSRPTLAMIGERGPEAVIPLGRGGAGGPMTVVLNVDGRRLADIVVANLNRASSNGGAVLR
jgi:SLT domain-containing protein